jgi:hypothetical protein
VAAGRHAIVGYAVLIHRLQGSAMPDFLFVTRSEGEGGRNEGAIERRRLAVDLLEAGAAAMTGSEKPPLRR